MSLDTLIQNTIIDTAERQAAISAQELFRGTSADQLHIVLGFGAEDSVMLIMAPAGNGKVLEPQELGDPQAIPRMSMIMQQLADQTRSSIRSQNLNLPSKWWIKIEFSDGDPRVHSRGEYDTPVDLRGASGQAVGAEWGRAVEQDVTGAARQVLIERTDSGISLSGDLSQLATTE